MSKKRYSKLWVGVWCAVVVGLLALCAQVIYQPGGDGGRILQPSPSIRENHSLEPERIYSPNAILMDRDTGEAVWAKGEADRVRPASLTKLMTVILALEELEDLHERITLPEEIFPALYEENASMAGFLPGERVAAIDLLYGALLPSGAECCQGLAMHLAGSEAEFAARMNRKAEEIGCEDTHFTNTTGLDEAQHYSTVEDIARILQYALENPRFRELFTTRIHTTGKTDLHPDGITLRSTLLKQMDALSFLGGEILGGKTGYTSRAGLCLATLAVKEDSEYILVTAGAKGDHQTEQYNILDAVYIYENIIKDAPQESAGREGV